MEGTVHLLVEGAKRQSDDDRERWLSLVSSLMNVKISVSDMPSTRDTLTVNQMTSQNNIEKYVITSKLNSEQSLNIELSSISEQIISGTAFLILNDIGRFPANERQQQFATLTQVFPYPIARINAQTLNFDSEQQERLDRDETIIVWKTAFGRGLSINVFAPWGNSGDVLALGAIHFFDPFPNWLIMLGLLIALFFLALWVLGIIRRLSYQLTEMQKQVDAIEPEYLSDSKKAPTGNIVEQLKWKILSMSSRIEKLLGQKSYMIQAVSHDLRTPLSKAQFRLENLAIELGHDHPMLLATKRDLGQLNLLIDELLSYEKLSQSQDIKFERIDIGQLTKNLVQDMTVVYPTVTFNCTTSSCLADINKTLFIRMLENLINNAGQHCQSEVTVNLHSNTNTKMIELAVIDDGHGISEQAKESIFEPFFQEDLGRNSKKTGYGLGLAIVQQILKQHNATIQLVENGGKGAHFVVNIPLTQGGNREEK